MIQNSRRNAPGPQRYPAQTGSSPVIQRYQGQLMKQTGPSCWIYVVEAVADAYQRGMGYQQWDTSLLAAIINLYPRDMNSRENEFGTIEQDFATMIAKFQQMSHFKDRTSRDHIEEIVGRVIKRRDAEQRPNIRMFMQIFFPQPGEYRLTDVIAGFGKARALAQELKLTIRAHGNTEGELLGGRGTTFIGPNDDDPDVGAALRVNLNRPGATMGVRHRLKPRNYENLYDAPTNTYDLTGVSLTDITEGGYHAILLVSVNEGAHTLIYKDPNYGNASIKITFAQLKKMAVSMQQVNQQGVELQSFTTQGNPLLPGILTKHGKVPTMTPIPPLPQPIRQQPVARQQQQVRQRPLRQQQQVLPVQQPLQQQLPPQGNQAVVHNNGGLGNAAMWTVAALGIAGVVTAGYYGINALMMKPAIGRAPTPPPKPQPTPVSTMAPPPVYRPNIQRKIAPLPPPRTVVLARTKKDA